MTDEHLGSDEFREALRRLLTADATDPTIRQDREDFLEGLKETPALHALFKRLLWRAAHRSDIADNEVDIRTAVLRSDMKHHKDRPWTLFLDLVNYSEFPDFAGVHAAAYLAFWYEAEVYNGGHHQFFTNSTGRYARETVPALVVLGTMEHARVLERAIALVEGDWDAEWNCFVIDRDGPLIKSLREIDHAYHTIEPDITELLHRFLDEHFDAFFRVIEDEKA